MVDGPIADPLFLHVADDLLKSGQVLTGIPIQFHIGYVAGIGKRMVGSFQLDLPEIKEMTSLLKRCSNNLNQYAKKANQTGSIYEEDIRDLRKCLDSIYDQAELILKQLNALQGSL